MATNDKPRRGRPATGVNPAAPPEIRRLHRLCLASGLRLGAIAERAGLGGTSNLTRIFAGKRPEVALATVRKVLDIVGGRWADLDPPTDGPDIDSGEIAK